MNTWHVRSRLLTWLIFATLGISVSAQAQTLPDREGFRFGLEIGAGSVERKIAGSGIDETNFYMGFAGGYWIGRNVLAGLELNGWLLQASNLKDPTVGEGISRVFLSARIYPDTHSGWFAKVGGGYISLWNNRPGETRRKSGNGFEIGGGYDFGMGSPEKAWGLTPFVTYSSGTTDDEKHNAITIGVGVFWQF
jgi:hypothetical protein